MTDSPIPSDRDELLSALSQIAKHLPSSVRFGTSTWTYPGWTGLVYEKPYAKSAPAAKLLAEYARFPLFKTVGVDSFFYRAPSEATLLSYREALPSDFQCVMKVLDTITSYALGGPRHKGASGPNVDWLNAALFQREVLEPTLTHLGDNAGPFVFEFEQIPAYAKMTVEEFADRLHQFFAALPKGPRYSVELRNKAYLQPVYFDALRTHNVAHVFNSWTRMPSIGEQLKHDSMTADFTVVRALLKPGRTYNESVDAFAPYDRLQEEQPEVRDDIMTLIAHTLANSIDAYIIVNNRLEGSAPFTIIDLARRLMASR